MGVRVPNRHVVAVVLCLATGGSLITGCSAGQDAGDTGVRVTSGNLLFGGGRGDVLATRIGRNEWPATTGPLRSVEETYYIERYTDFLGSEHNERNYPQRRITSVRIGAQLR